MTAPQVLLKAWNLQAKKELGQNFLKDPSTPQTIVDRAKVTESAIIEIGPGLGALTIPASRATEKLTAVEADRDLVPLLKAELLAARCENVEVINRSILKVDLEPLLAEGRNTMILGNLPYNISSQILIRLLALRHRITRGVFMLQKEMADRIAAPPASREYGRISAVLQYCGAISKVVDVKHHLFFPKPKIDSAVIEIAFPETPELRAKDEALLFAVIKGAFGKRRKTLRNSIGTSELPIDTRQAAELLEAADIDEKRRAETLTPEEFVQIADAWLALGWESPFA